MQRQITIKNRKLRYAVKVSRRAKTMRLDAYYDGRFVLTIPRGMDEGLIRAFIRQKALWMIEQIRLFRKFEGGIFFKSDRRLYLAHKEKAREFVNRRLAYYRSLYRVQYGKVRIKNHRSMWGSCSSKKNLNFNYKLLFLPRQVADYIIVHELCHLRHLDHSARFWHQVAKTFPNYRQMERQLKSRF
ncbi:MAG: M48 family metallopeptidase [Candidatus Yanofskybacteria bacterium]|nr:M48 family metallopeptidase [Candidatus Yanofskybacteria bacterium]